jgi:hypothetical protein
MAGEVDDADACSSKLDAAAGAGSSRTNRKRKLKLSGPES